MTSWTTDERAAIANAVEIGIAPTRPDGSAGRPTTIWLVEVDGHLYVRSYHGPDGAWYGGHGAATAAGSPPDEPPTTRSSSSPRTSTGQRSTPPTATSTPVMVAPTSTPMVTPRAAAATLRLDPASPKEDAR